MALVTAALLIVTPVLAQLSLLDPLPDLLTAATAGVLVPIWAIWIGRAVDRGTSYAAGQPS